MVRVILCLAESSKRDEKTRGPATAHPSVTKTHRYFSSGEHSALRKVTQHGLWSLKFSFPIWVITKYSSKHRFHPLSYCCSNRVDHFQGWEMLFQCLHWVRSFTSIKLRARIQCNVLNLLQRILDPQTTGKGLWMLLLRQQGSHWLAMNFLLSNLGQIWTSDPEGRAVTSRNLPPARPVPSLCFIKLICLKTPLD